MLALPPFRCFSDDRALEREEHAVRSVTDQACWTLHVLRDDGRRRSDEHRKYAIVALGELPRSKEVFVEDRHAHPLSSLRGCVELKLDFRRHLVSRRQTDLG